MTKQFKHEVFSVVDAGDHHNWLSKIFNIFLVALIVLNVIAVSVDTVASYYIVHKQLFDGFEIFSVAVFTLELALKVWSVTASGQARYKDPLWGRLRFMLTFGSVVDVLSVLPFYLLALIPFGLQWVSILRLIRLVRVLKISRYLRASALIRKVLISKRDELAISFMLTIFLMVIASSIMFYIEHNAQPDKFTSIPETMWWSVATITTSGDSGMFPVTPIGKILSSLISILGIGLVALPAGIFASGFSDEVKREHEAHEKKYCPYCGKEL